MINEHEELKEEYNKQYEEMKKKLCPQFKEICFMERCIAFKGHCIVTENSHNIHYPHCMKIFDTEMLYELFETIKPQWINEYDKPQWKSLDEYEYHSDAHRHAVDELRKKHGLDEKEEYDP
ncbi:MAG: hypothetical protein Q8M94_12795 [Ignavibacteria bacterium]|nr:hypothetical protein [Ignavibacteria bacterium]